MFELNSEFKIRFEKMLESEEFLQSKSSEKTEYWNHFSQKIIESNKNSQIPNKIISGVNLPYYLPSLLTRLTRIFRDPKKLIKYLFKNLIFNARYPYFPTDNLIRLYGYGQAFDKVMNRENISFPNLSPYRVNFEQIKEKSGNYKNYQEICNMYFSEKHSVGDHVVYAYYWFNILNTYLNLKSANRIIEIGGGNGHLMSILHHHYPHSTIIDIDLPEMISINVRFIHELFPKSKIMLPNEINLENFDEYDFVFLTPSQIDLIEDNSINLVVSTSTFQELKHDQLETYFELIQRCCVNMSHYFISSRVEKIPSGDKPFEIESKELPNRFSEYPWNKNNKCIIYEVCRLNRLVQLDNSFIRMDQVIK